VASIRIPNSLVSLFVVLSGFFFSFSNVIAKSKPVLNELICPSLEEVKNHKNIWPHGSWMPLYTSNEELAREKDIERFHESAYRFKRAEWNEDYLEAGHCFYDGVDDIILARDMLPPDAIQYPVWVYQNKKVAWCEKENPGLCVYGVWERE